MTTVLVVCWFAVLAISYVGSVAVLKKLDLL